MRMQLTVTRRLLTLPVAIAILAVPVPAWCQAHTLEDLASKVREGRSVVLRSTNAGDVAGAIWTVSADTVVLQTKQGLKAFQADDIRKISARDPIWDGGIIGAGIGTVAGAMLFGFSSCEGCFMKPFGDTPLVASIALSAAIGGAIGVGIDAAIPAKTLYIASARATVMPIVGQGRAGIQGTIRW